MRLTTINFCLSCLPLVFCAGAYALPVTSYETDNCDALVGKESAQVRKAYGTASAAGVISPDHKCLLKTVEQVDDIGALLEAIPENTVLFIVQKPKNDGHSPYSFSVDIGEKPDSTRGDSDALKPLYSSDHRRSLTFDASGNSDPEQPESQKTSVSAQIQITQLSQTTQCVPSKTFAHLKKGTVLLGVNEETPYGGIPLCEAEEPERIWLMFEVGHNDEFEDIGKLYINGFNFYPLLDNDPDPVDSIWRVRCYTGSIHFENNYFRLDTRSSVYLQCTHNTKEDVYFKFQGNTVIGMGKARSNEGLLVDLRSLENQGVVADLKNNWFAGNIKSAIEVRLNIGSKVNITNNHIRPAISEFRQVYNGLELHGPSNSVEAKNKPEISVTNNYLQTSNAGLVFYSALKINTAGNTIKSNKVIEISSLTDEGYHTVPAIELTSSTSNSWLSHSKQCPVIHDQSHLKGNLKIAIKPEGKLCDMHF